MKIRSITSGMTAAFVVGTATWVVPGSAQVVGNPITSPGIVVGAGGAFEQYRFGTAEAANIQSLSLMTAAFQVQVPLVAGSRAGIRGNFAEGALVRADGSKATVSGLTDTELTLGFPIRRGNLAATVTGILVLPTGHATHTEAEAEVAGAIAADLLPLRISHWGSGGGAGINLAAAHTLGASSVGLSAGYLVAREFEPVQAASERFLYRPGNQLQIRAAWDRTVGSASKAAVSLLLQNHSDDQSNGVNLYRAGTRYQAMASYAFPLGSTGSGIAYAGGMHRAHGTALVDFDWQAPAQNLILLGGGLRTPAGRGVLLPSLDARIFRSEDGVGQGFLAGLGAAWEVPVGSTLLVPNLRARTGRILVRQGLESSVMALETGFAARWGHRPVR